MHTLTMNMFAETNEDMPIISGMARTQLERESTMNTLTATQQRVKVFSHPTLTRWHADVKVNQHGRHYVITVDDQDLWNANPLKLNDGHILYDHPERVPAYAKALTAKAYRWIEEQVKP